MCDKAIIIDVDVITVSVSFMERAQSHAASKRISKHRHVSLVFPLAVESHNIKITVRNVLNYFQLILLISMS